MLTNVLEGVWIVKQFYIAVMVWQNLTSLADVRRKSKEAKQAKNCFVLEWKIITFRSIG